MHRFRFGIFIFVCAGLLAGCNLVDSFQPSPTRAIQITSPTSIKTSLQTPIPSVTALASPSPTETLFFTPTIDATPTVAASPTPIITASSTSTVTLSPSPTPHCAQDYTRLKPGDQAHITPGLSNRVRSEPSLAGEVLTLLNPGTVVSLLEGPVCSDGLVFWKVESSLIPGSSGWTAEGDGKEYWMIAYQPELKDGSWQKQSPVKSPAPRKGVGMVYASHRKVLVMAGGTDWVKAWGETWEYDGKSWKLRQDVNPLPERLSVAMAYDPDRQVTVLFGGSSLGDEKFFDDTWEYDGNAWVPKDTAQSPPPRNGAAMAYDALGKRLLLFGGYNRFSNPAFYADTWEYKNGEWRELYSSKHPLARETARMVYDESRQVLALFGGGHDAGYANFNDTWEWQNNAWVRRTDLPVSPPAPTAGLS